MTDRVATDPLRCHADRDGDCSPSCPQLADGEPAATGRHCPLDIRFDDWAEPDPADLARRDAYLTTCEQRSTT